MDGEEKAKIAYQSKQTIKTSRFKQRVINIEHDFDRLRNRLITFIGDEIKHQIWLLK